MNVFVPVILWIGGPTEEVGVWTCYLDIQIYLTHLTQSGAVLRTRQQNWDTVGVKRSRSCMPPPSLHKSIFFLAIMQLFYETIGAITYLYFLMYNCRPWIPHFHNLIFFKENILLYDWIPLPMPCEKEYHPQTFKNKNIGMKN